MDKDTVLLFTRNGLGQGPEALQNKLAVKFLSLINDANTLPSKILFYTDGVRLACQGSPTVDVLKQMETKGVELVLCQTCLDFFGLSDQVAVGMVGGMPDIIDALSKAEKVVSL